MVITANTPYEASVQLLQVVWAADFRNSAKPKGVIAFEYVYFNPIGCRFSSNSVQLADRRRDLLKKYVVVDAQEAIHIAATKYRFSTIVIGAVAYRNVYIP